MQRCVRPARTGGPRTVGGVAAIDRLLGEPRRGATNSGTQALVLEHPLDLRPLLGDLRGRELLQARHHVVVVELHAVEAERLVERNFSFVREGRAHFGAERIGAFADVPRAKGEAVFMGLLIRRDGGVGREDFL